MNQSTKNWYFALCVIVAAIATASTRAADIGTAFTYQGTLENGSGPVTDTCDFRFGLWLDAVSVLPAFQVGALQSIPGVEVVAGVFTTTIDFGAGSINGTARWLAIEVQCPGDAGLVLLSPRVELTAAPHALALRNFRVEPAGPDADDYSGPNIVGGYAGNSTAPGVVGATVFGGGQLGAVQAVNHAGGAFATVTGGIANQANAAATTISGGYANQAEQVFSTVSGGSYNSASGYYATVPGGDLNSAGGDYSFAAGSRAKIRDSSESGDPDGDEGTFAWADSTNTNFLSTGPDQFLIRASGGIRLATGGGSTPTLQSILPSTDTPTSLAVNPLGGNVGIGTMSPITSLDVAGTFHASGTIASGNSLTIDGAAHIITSDGDLELHVADGRIMRYESNATAPNMIGGHASNSIEAGTHGASTGGGSGNENNGNFGTIAGGGPGGRFATGAIFRCDIGGGTCTRCSVSLNPCTSDASCSGSQTCVPMNSVCTAIDPASICEPEYILECIGGPDHLDACGTCEGGPSAGATCRWELQCGLGGTCQPNPSFCGSPGVCSNARGNLVIGDWGTVGGGAGNSAIGAYSAVPGGASNRAGGDYSFAGGRGATVRDAATVGDLDGDQGSFVFADASTSSSFTSTGPNQFLIRAAGGIGINRNNPLFPFHVGNSVSNGNGAHVTAGGTWTNGSSRLFKQNFREIDKLDLLRRLALLPVLQWQYYGESEFVQHIGPVAEDFAATFGLGHDERYITTIDADGVALAAIQGLHSLVEEKDCRIQSLDTEISNLKSEVGELKSLVKALADRQHEGDQK